MLHEKLKPKFSSLKFICILFAALILNACRKTDLQTINYVSEQTKKEVVSKFLTLPNDAPAYLQRIVTDIKKTEAKTPFLYELVKAYGMPVWQNTIGKTGVATTQTLNRFNGEVNINAVKTLGVTTNQADTSKGKFFIPLKDTNTNEITSFISCEKHNDTLYTYTVYNKQNILNTPLVGDSAKIYAKAELAFFAYFEKTINAKTHSSFTGLQTNYQFNNVNINFNVSPNIAATTNTRVNAVKQPENAINIVLADPCYRLLYLYSIDYGNGDIEYYFTVTTCPTLPDVTVISTPRGGGGSNSGSTPGGTPAPPGNGMPVTAPPGGGGGNSGGGPGGGNAPGDPYNPIILPWPPNWGIGNPYIPPATVIADPNGNSFDYDLLYPELNSVLDITARSQYKEFYYNLTQQYSSSIDPQYRNMPSEDFARMLAANPSLASTIDPITILIKVGAAGAADVLTQIFFIKLTDPSVTSWGDAFSKVDWWQVAGSAVTSLLPWNTTSGKFLIAAINGAAAAISDLSQHGFQSWGQLGLSFVQGFCGSLLGSYMGDIILKFGSVGNFGKALVTKLDNAIPYSTICKWLGGGLQIAAESLSTSNGVITSVRKMVGWASGKVCIVGRNMSGRVIPYAQTAGAAFFDESNSLAAPYFTKALKDEWKNLENIYGSSIPYNEVKNSLWYKQNQQFIKDLQSLGYTFIDLGGTIGESAFYDIEMSLIFN